MTNRSAVIWIDCGILISHPLGSSRSNGRGNAKCRADVVNICIVSEMLLAQGNCGIGHRSRQQSPFARVERVHLAKVLHRKRYSRLVSVALLFGRPDAFEVRAYQAKPDSRS